MKKTLAIIAATLTLAASAAYASSIEFDQRGEKSQLQLCIEQPIKGTVGAFAYTCQTEGWGETYAGLTYAPIPEVQIALGTGIETGGARTGGWVWAGKGKTSVIYLAEDGTSGPWQKVVAKYQVTSKVALGYTEKSFVGKGLYVDFKLTKSATLKFSNFKQNGQNLPEFGLKLSF